MSHTFIFLHFFTRALLHAEKLLGGVGVGGGPCDYCVRPSPKNWVFGFFRLGLTLESGFGAY